MKTLLYIKDWDFAWQDRYYFDHFVSLPRGTRLDAEIHWDNSADNPRNPSNPPTHVEWGEQSKDEMGSLTLTGVARQQSDFAALQKDYLDHRQNIAREAMRKDPALRRKVMALLAQ